MKPKINIIEEEGIFERLGLWDKMEELKKEDFYSKQGKYYS